MKNGRDTTVNASPRHTVHAGLLSEPVVML